MTKKELNIIKELLEAKKQMDEDYELLSEISSSNPISLSEDVYDGICDYLNVETVYLFGIA